MSGNKELVKVERESAPENLHVDEGMMFLEKSLERGWLREPSAEEVHAFDQSMKRKLKDLARRADREHADRESEEGQS